MILQKLQNELTLYLFFWEEWVSNENCNLFPDEVTTLNYYIKTGFISFINTGMDKYREIEKLEALTKKLNISYPVFKEVVVLDFLFTLIKFARESPNGFDTFLQTPIHQLDMRKELKEALLELKVHSIHLIPIIYRDIDLSVGWVYKKIVNFHVINRKAPVLK